MWALYLIPVLLSAIVLNAQTPAQPPRLSVPSYKGIDYGWSSNNFGTPAYEHWLTDAYDPTSIARDLDALANTGTLTTTAWLFLDRCIVKDSSWGTQSYTPSFYPDCLSNWEAFLRQLGAHHMAVIVNLLNRGAQYGGAGDSLERAALAPRALDSSLLGPGVNNGDMALLSNGFPVGWDAEGTGQASLSGSGSTPSGNGKYISLVAGSDAPESIHTPLVPFDGNSLLAVSVPVQGNIRRISILYFDGGGMLLSTEAWPVGNDFKNVWSVLHLGTSGISLLPPGIASMAVRVDVTPGTSGAVGPVRIGLGERNAIWQNYQAAIGAWVARYSGTTQYGKAIIGWQPIDEGYSGVSWETTWGTVSPGLLHSFYLDIYGTIRSVPGAQPVGFETAATGLPLWSQSTAGNLLYLPFYTDIADFYNLHLFDDAGTIPPGVALFGKPWLLGEVGASIDGSPAHFSDPTQSYEPNAVASFLAGGRSAGALAVLPWTFNTNLDLIYIEKMKVTLGPAGQFLNDFQSDAHRNAASYSTAIAAGSIVAAFGNSISSTTAQATFLPLPEILAGLSLDITDANGVIWPAPLIYVSPKQIIYQLPPGTAPGWTLATMRGTNGYVGTGLFVVTNIAPGIFSADGSGTGPAAAVAARYSADAFLSYAFTAAYNPVSGALHNSPIDLSIDGQVVVLELYGVGVRNFSTQVTIQVSPGGMTLPVQYAGPAPGFPGLDQINVILPKSLAGSGAILVQVVTDGVASNQVQLEIK